MQPFPNSFVIGGTTIAPATVLAPMAGITDTVFRQFIRNQGGCGLLMTEFTSSHGVVAAINRKKPTRTVQDYLSFEEHERPITAQLFGADPKVLSEAARYCEDMGFDFVDLNLGCPVKKVVKCNGGSGLLRDLPLVGQILTQVKSAIRIPLTLKCRAGWNDNELVFLELGKVAEESGLSAIALHPRTREQGYSGLSDWQRIAALKSAVHMPVIGNGDIHTPEDALRMVRETSCDAVMIGRAAASNPWIFRQIAEFLATGSYMQPTEEDRYRIMRDYYDRLLAHPEPETVGKMKQFATYFTHGVRGGAALRRAVYQCRTGEEVVAEVDRFFEAQLMATA
jgi:tRNA-dihydrouridine synthase B